MKFIKAEFGYINTDLIASIRVVTPNDSSSKRIVWQWSFDPNAEYTEMYTKERWEYIICRLN